MFGNQSSSVTRCLPAMEQCYAEGLIKFDTKATKPLQKYFEANSNANLEFRLQLYNINMLLKPISRGLKTLESSQVTCSDVFNIWIGLGIGFKQVFNDPVYYDDGALRLVLPPRQNISKGTASALVTAICGT
ncbi:hypothetical protein B0H10DRAFT_1962768 [Mycena sp. CBHHK59/15]|nr:hypothetical protein B0H10DRAFT_1962768 [Mycena sp. CBHHK59/15]